MLRVKNDKKIILPHAPYFETGRGEVWFLRARYSAIGGRISHWSSGDPPSSNPAILNVGISSE